MATLTSLLLVCVLFVLWCNAGFLPTFPDISIPGLPKIQLPNPFKQAGNNTENGNFAGMGRDIIRKLQDTVGKVVDDVFGSVTKGLDTDKTFFSGVTHEFKKHLKAIYPGTRWCGQDNKADSKDDLGLFSETDKCCREHDNCPDNIKKGRIKYNLTNTGLFTRSNCACDKRFYNCLKTSNGLLQIAFQIGTTYFTVLGPQCFKKAYPILSCLKHAGLTHRCVKYRFNKNAAKKYQWFDNPEFELFY